MSSISQQNLTGIFLQSNAFNIMVNLLVTIVAINPQKRIFHHIVASEMKLENCMKITFKLLLHIKKSFFPLI